MDSDILTPFLLIIFVIFLIWQKFWKHTETKKYNLPPGPPRLPIIGNLHQVSNRPFLRFKELEKEYGPIFSLNYASWFGIVLNDPHHIRTAFAQNVFAGRPKNPVFKDRTYGDKVRGIIMSEKKEWMEQRRFVLNNLRDLGYGRKTMEVLIIEAVQKIIKKLNDLGDAGKKPVQTEFIFLGAVLTSLWTICSGEELNDDDPQMAEILKVMTRSFSQTVGCAICFFFPKLGKLFPRYTGYESFITNIHVPVLRFVQDKIAKQKSEYDGGPPRNLFEAFFDKINSTTDPESSFYDQEGVMQMSCSIMDMFLAAVETTGTSLIWIFLVLGLHPEIQEKIQKEIEENIISGCPTLVNRVSMPYVEAFTMEVSRFASVVPLGFFRNTTEDTQLLGYDIPKETMVAANLHGVHHDTKTWGDPEIIRPERFLLPNGEVNRHHPSYMPFSVGKRFCLGEGLARDELFLFTTTICQQFRVELNPNEPRPTLEYKAGLALSPLAHSLLFVPRD